MRKGSQQLLLNIPPEWRSSLDNFVAGANAELLARLHALVLSKTFEAIYLWGPAGCGRSHLLRTTAETARRCTVFVPGTEADGDLSCPPGGLLIVDDVEQLNEVAQIALFRAFNTAHLAGLALLMSGSVPPRELTLREDLRTRIGSALIFEVKPLSDADKVATLKAHAARRGLPLDDELITWLLRHAPRDLSTLMTVLEGLDRASLEHKRPVTLPLLRDVFNSLNLE